MQERLNDVITKIKAKPNVQEITTKIDIARQIIALEKLIPEKYRIGFVSSLIDWSKLDPLFEALQTGTYKQDSILDGYLNNRPYYTSPLEAANIREYVEALYRLHFYLADSVNPGSFEYRPSEDLVESVKGTTDEIIDLTNKIKTDLLTLSDENKVKFDDADIIFGKIQKLNAYFGIEIPQAPPVPVVI